jgi:glycosyltransferase involved in cell wall biosynthesis
MKCGVADYTANLAQALGRREDTAVAVLTDIAATPVPSDFDFEVFPIANGWRMADVIRIAKVARRWHPDLVHVQLPAQGYGRRYLPWLLPSLFSMVNVPVVQTWHEPPYKRNLITSVFRGGVITVRPNYKATMPNLFRWLIRKKRFEFIPSASAIPRMRLTEKEKLAIRSHFALPPTRLVVYFGFAYPSKCGELLFEIADPSQDHLILICDLNSADEYHKVILDRVNCDPWIGKVTVTGFLPVEEVGRILATADAVVLPFRDGGGVWNTSIRAAVAQGTFVLTTAREQHGYDSLTNVYYARPNDVADMSCGLRTHIGNRRPEIDEDPASEWEVIAEAHRAFYASVL